MPSRHYKFAKQQRLTEPEDFSEVFKLSNRVADANFIILYRRNGLDHARLGTAITKKNVRLATGRNRLKRIIRESFRVNVNSIQHFDVVVLAKKNINVKNRRMMTASLSKLWLKIPGA